MFDTTLSITQRIVVSLFSLLISAVLVLGIDSSFTNDEKINVYVVDKSYTPEKVMNGHTTSPYKTTSYTMVYSKEEYVVIVKTLGKHFSISCSSEEYFSVSKEQNLEAVAHKGIITGSIRSISLH